MESLGWRFLVPGLRSEVNGRCVERICRGEGQVRFNGFASRGGLGQGDHQMRAVARRRDFRGIPLESRQSSEYQETGGVQCRADADTPPRHPGEVEDYWQERCIFWRRRHRYRVTEGVVGVFWAGSEMIRRDLMLARGRWTCRLPRWWPSQGAISRIISQCTHKRSGNANRRTGAASLSVRTTTLPFLSPVR